jgi:hypothetical protein
MKASLSQRAARSGVPDRRRFSTARGDAADRHRIDDPQPGFRVSSIVQVISFFLMGTSKNSLARHPKSLAEGIRPSRVGFCGLSAVF